jgi:putative peptidoglycan lipid II flippase
MSFFKKVFSFSFFTFISRIFGLIRDTVIAFKIGAGSASDIFFVALKVPNFLRAIFAEGAFTQAFIPIYNNILRKDKQEAKRFSNNIFFYLLIILSIFVILLEVYMDKVMVLFAPGFLKDPDKFNHLVFIARITFPYLIFISICCLYSAILNSYHKYIPTAIVPIITNIFLIVGILTLFEYTKDHVLSLALAFVTAGIVQIIYLIYQTYKINILIKPCYSQITQNERSFGRKILPAIIGASIVQINIWIDTIFASLMDGVVSYYNYAERLINLPVALAIVSITIVLLPSLTQAIQSSDESNIQKYNHKSIHLALALVIPAATGLYLLAAPIIYTLFARGEFSLVSTYNTALILKILALHLPAICILRIINTNFFARSDTKTPMKIACLLMILNIIFNYIFVQIFSFLGIAISTTLITWIGVFLGLVILKKHHGNIFSFSLDKSFYIKIICSSVVMGIVIMFFNNIFFSELNHSEIKKISNLTVTILISGSCFFISNIILFGSFKKFKSNF